MRLPTARRKVAWEAMRRVLLLSVLIAACSRTVARALAGVAYDPALTQVVMLGTGTPNPDPAHSGPALAIVIHGAAYLVDAGPGVVRRAAAAERAGVAALAQPNLRIVFITHLHSDHTLGLPDLIFSPWVLQRRAPLDVYGPPGIAAMTDTSSGPMPRTCGFARPAASRIRTAATSRTRTRSTAGSSTGTRTSPSPRFALTTAASGTRSGTAS